MKLNRELKNHDSFLYLQEMPNGRFDVYRRSSLGCNPPHLIFSLTSNWTVKGRPIEYGIDVVLARIKAHDLWRDDTFVDNYIKSHQKLKESQDRDLSNNIESFLYDFRSQFAKATDGINTSNLEKIRPKY